MVSLKSSNIWKLTQSQQTASYIVDILIIHSFFRTANFSLSVYKIEQIRAVDFNYLFLKSSAKYFKDISLPFSTVNKRGFDITQCKTSVSVPASGLSNLRVSIPDNVARGSDVAFNCSFNLQDEELYAVKWYRGNYEIFRYVPSEAPAIKTFHLEGFNISVSS